MWREIGAEKERIVGWLLVVGLIVSVISGILCWTFAAAGVFRGTYTRTPVTNQITDAGALNLVPLTIVGICVGLLMIVGGIGYGFLSMEQGRRGPRRTVSKFHVLARYCYDRNQNLVTSEADMDAVDRPKFYVRAVLEDGRVGEFEAPIEVFFSAGEGMTGDAELQGQWLGRFTPHIGYQTREE